MYDEFLDSLTDMARNLARQDGAEVFGEKNWRALFEKCQRCRQNVFYAQAIGHSRVGKQKHIVRGCPCGGIPLAKTSSLPIFRIEWGRSLAY